MVTKIRRSFGLSLVLLIVGFEVSSYASVSITRHHKGDLFMYQDEECYEDLCLGMSSGTANPTDFSGCNCQCLPELPVFREDLHLCVNDIQECTLAPFQSDTSTQKVPYVFLPLKGQIVYPSAEIIVTDVANPVCVVSGAEFLGRRGWVQLRNNSETDLPFRLFRDEGRTYLQWLGESDLRLAMEGRLILVHLMCKDASGEEELRIFTPCIAFRIAGNPAGPREMMFATDVGVVSEGDRSLSISEYIATGVCILLLGLIYMSSLVLYFHYRKKKKMKQMKESGDGARLTMAEEGIMKSNPLLQATRKHLVAVAGQDNGGYVSDSGSCYSESDRCSDTIPPQEDVRKCPQNMEIAAIVHPCNMRYNLAADSMLNADPNNSIEKLPEEDVSIVETLELKEEGPETVRGMGSASARKKLYFNPAYFELDLLKAPPPAAIEFLTKIREVIAAAKHKMSARKFSPSLIGIPEEEYYARTGKANSTGKRSRPASALSHVGSAECKRKNKEPPELPKTENNRGLPSTMSCCIANDTKQRIIRRWLEDVTYVKSPVQEYHGRDAQPSLTSRNKGETKEEKKPEETALPNDSPKMINEARKTPSKPPQRKDNKKSTKGPAPPRPSPPPPIDSVLLDKGEYGAEWKKALNFSAFDIESGESAKSRPPPPPPPPPIHTKNLGKAAPDATQPVLHRRNSDDIPRIQGKDKVPPGVAKNLMDAVLRELNVQRKNEKSQTRAIGVNNFLKRSLKTNFDMVHDKNARNEKFQVEEDIFEMDSLDGNAELEADTDPGKAGAANKRNEELTQSNEAVKDSDPFIAEYNDNVAPTSDEVDNLVKSNENEDHATMDEHDYEVILLNFGLPAADDEKERELKIYNLPEILSKNERSDGYSLVSEVYVNDGYTYSNDGSAHSNNSGSNEEKVQSVPTEKLGRLTIEVTDCPDNHKDVVDETANFEPDTLDRKPEKFKHSKTIGKWEEGVQEQYSNQRFHEMDMDCRHNNINNNESFIDSLERPRISLRASEGSRTSSLEKDAEERRLSKNMDPPLKRHFGSLREIYEAKNGGHRKRTKATSLIGSAASDIDRRSTLSWSGDVRNELFDRDILFHALDEKRKQRKHKVQQQKIFHPVVLPPRPPKPQPLPEMPLTRSPSASTPPRSNCNSPPPVEVRFPSPPPPPPPPRSANSIPGGCISPTHSGRTTPFLPQPPSYCSSPTCFSDLASFSKCMVPQSRPRSLCSSPVSQNRTSPSSEVIPPPPPRVTSGMNLWNATSLTPTHPGRTPPCVSPVSPPRPSSKRFHSSPPIPIPPRTTKPPLPPKSARNTRHKKHGGEIVHGRQNLARRPLPPIPSSRNYHDSNHSSVSSYDPETLSMVSGASIDSLNSSDYEAFYTVPYDRHEEGIFDKPRRLALPCRKNNFDGNSAPDAIFITGDDNCNVSRTSSIHSRRSGERKSNWTKRGESLGRPLKVPDGRCFPHRQEDVGYLSTDSESGRRHRPHAPVITSYHVGSQGSETEESLCDGASESGAESIATDSFFFGNFNRAKTAGSLDSGVGSEARKSSKQPNAESEDRDELCRSIRQ